MIRRPAVAVFLDPPRLGDVKQALAEEIGPRQALRLYRVLVARTLAAVRALDLPAVIWFAPAGAQGEMRRWLGPDWVLRAQVSGRLGARVAAAAHGVEPGTPWLVVLSECVGLAPEVMGRARDALLDHPAVMGATQSGGCYLLGARGPLPGLGAGLDDEAGSAASQLRSTLDRLAPQWHELPTLGAIMTGADARAAGLLT